MAHILCARMELVTLSICSCWTLFVKLLREVSGVIYHIFAVKPLPIVLCARYTSVSVRNTRAKRQHSVNPFCSNKTLRWLSYAQFCLASRTAERFEKKVVRYPATLSRTPEERKPRLPSWVNHTARRAFLCLMVPRLRLLVLLITSWSRFLTCRLVVSEIVKDFLAFYGDQPLITLSQEPATCPTPEPHQSSLCSHPISSI